MDFAPSLSHEFDLSYAHQGSGGGGDSCSSSESTSSSSHSSPHSSDSPSVCSTSSTHPDWSLDLGLSIPTLVGKPSWSDQINSQQTHHLTRDQIHQQEDEWMAANNQDWRPLPQGDTEEGQGGRSEMEQEGHDDQDLRDLSRTSSFDMEFDDMVHQDVCGPSTLNSPLSSGLPASTVPTTLMSLPSSLSYSHISMPSSNVPNPQPQSFLASAGLALQLPPPPPSTSAGIAPSLTGGQPTPPLGSPITSILPELPPLSSSSHKVQRSPSLPPLEQKKNASPPPPPPAPASVTRPTRERRTSSRAVTSGLTTRGSTASASSSRERPLLPVGGLAATNGTTGTTAIAAGSTTVGGVNLVSRDAILAAHLIPNISNPPISTLVSSSSSSSSSSRGRAVGGYGVPPVKLLVLGVPQHGAKSRVETQIKISLVLVKPRSDRIKREDGAGSSSSGDWGSLGEEEFVNEDGSVDVDKARNDLERVGSWSHIRLPKFLALKSKVKEDVKGGIVKKPVIPSPEPHPEQTLNLDVAVVRASDPSSCIFICQNCRARELKRSLRKKEPKGSKKEQAPPPPPPPVVKPEDGDDDKDEEEEKRKVVVFNSPEFVEFGTGECVLPTRVTCYCRHHKEKKGFCVTYSLRDHLDNVVASGMTPPIMITDDHKTSVAKHVVAATAPTPAVPVVAATEPTTTKRKAPSGKSTTNGSTGKKEAKEKATTTTTTRSRRSAAATGRSRRGASDSGDEEEENGGVASSTSTTANKKAKPYDVDSRPRKRQSPSTHRSSPSFAMTPLHNQPAGVTSPRPASIASGGATSNATSPAPSFAFDQRQAPSAAPSPASNGTALGLDGINGSQDVAMTDSTSFAPPPTSTVSPRNSISTESSLPPQHQPHNLFDWRSNGNHSVLSTPPLSPGATTPSVHNESYNSLFFPSPNPSNLEPHHAPPPPPQSLPPMSTIPSFAIPATEPMQSLTSTWAFQQALQQQQQEIAAAMPPPRINRLIPGEGPVSGGIEVTILGENFVRDLTCLFGDSGAVATHFWSTNTLVCVLPPSANPGPVFVGIKGVLHNPEQGGLPLFTYKDHSDRNLLELALQVVGLKMTGRLEDASAVAMRIVGNGAQGGQAGGGHQSHPGSIGGGGGGHQDTAALAATLNAAAASAYATPSSSRPSSRRGSVTNNAASPSPSTVATSAGGGNETRNFEGIVIKFLSLLDLDASLIPGAAPSVPSSSPPISQADAQHHTLLHLATVLGFHRLVSFLLARGIDFDAPDRNGYTALHFAALYGRVAITRQLLEVGADVTLETFANKTALDIAQDRDDVDVEDLLLRHVPSPSSSQITPRISRRQLVTFSPASYSRPASLYDGSEDEAESSYDDGGDARTTEESNEDVSSDEGSYVSSDWPTDSDEEEEEEDEVEEVFERQSRSRNASTISLQYLLEAEAEASAVERASPKTRKIPLPEAEVDHVQSIQKPTSKPPLSASSSASWLSKKLKPTMPPGLDKLQPLTGGMTNVWEKAKANRFALPHMQMPQMHMPELTAFHAMPAALTRRMSTTRRRSATNSSGGEEIDGGEESGWEGATKQWRALYSGQWWNKTPSSPPPQYTPSDSLAVATDDKVAFPSTSTSTTASTSTAIESSLDKLTRRRLRKLSVASEDTDDSASIAASEYDSTVVAPPRHTEDKMLWYFWLPILVVVLAFSYINFSTYLAPVIDTLSDMGLPPPIAKLLA